MRIFSEAAERNKLPILDVLQTTLIHHTVVLEIGSGTGQHALFFASILGHLIWQPTEIPDNLPDLQTNCNNYSIPNLNKPIPLDVDDEPWSVPTVDTIFTANTLHIINWSQVCRIFKKVSSLLPYDGLFCAYGPFNVNGQFTSQSNARFDAELRMRNPESGIRDMKELVIQAEAQGLWLEADHPMPANNRLLVWRKLMQIK
ncbi:Protein of unknown function [Nitrosomonas cryotolerans]|uniref:DUF938 domain-containing protein n=1 Tax=Nitrosomonas cryotolerans ATCC 49181 TaxID=1131553 RepID=A0A1N6IVN8_9PROT|nr:DUF938 domain-containing protein [Nitrosomonas cryotolerans]SFP90612.1 Protein of unknown function [Nitrosomonas cryotolerans]SIO35976.1 Protein of unknown function [Nitrosomonas cryotolerans ATCC 49181]